MLVEGVHTAKTALALAGQLGVLMPITGEVNKVLFEGKSPEQTVQSLMERDRKSEYIVG
jgi:glycerol-3-phosphate dehydrogenase (NAD(P)+)